MGSREARHEPHVSPLLAGNVGSWCCSRRLLACLAGGEGVVRMVALPTWADNIVPVDMDGAAVLLGVSRRYLVDVLRHHPHFERRGVKKVFYPEHISQLRAALCEPSHTAVRASSSNASTASGTSMEPLPENAFERALALATRQRRTSSRQNTKRGSGNVISLAKKP